MANEEWRESFMSYNRLKRILNKIKASCKEEKRRGSLSLQVQPQEAERLIGLSRNGDTKSEFLELLETELIKVSEFYTGKLTDIRVKCEDLFKLPKPAVSPQKKLGKEEESMKAKLLKTYSEGYELKKFGKLNFSSFRKILKKYDKITKETRLEEFLVRLRREGFHNHIELNELLEDLNWQYSNFTQEPHHIKVVVKEIELSKEKNSMQFTWKPLWVIVAFILGAVLLAIPIFKSEPTARRCLALLISITCLWVFEAVPYFATSLSIPPLAVILRVFKEDDGTLMDAEDATKFALSKVFDHTVALIMGGFALSAVFSKFQLEIGPASFLQRKLGKQPKLFLLGFMAMAFFLSMWISNVAGSVLCMAILAPIVHDLPRGSKYTKTILLGLAFACNLGGMLSPISSPQNAIAIGYLDSKHSISFLKWIFVSLPFCLVALFLCWVYLLITCRPDENTKIPEIVWDPPQLKLPLLVVLGTSVLTIALWITLSWTAFIFGDIGIVAFLPVMVFFSLGILSKDEFSSFQWNLIFLIGGGNVLGAAISSSDLLKIIGDAISPHLHSLPPWLAFFAIICFVGGVTTFVSHTVASIILIPIVIEVGKALGAEEIFTMGATFMCSSAMALPMSSFPNINSLLMEDEQGRPYLRALDFIIYGGPFTFIMLALLASWGYFLLTMILHQD